STVTSELSGEKIDIIEWNEDPALFIEEALSPAEVVSLELDDSSHRAIVTVTEDEQSLAIGKGGQNVRLAAKLTGWKIDIKSTGGDELAEAEDEDEEKESATIEEVK
ncbi:MAG: KH domain-containing protein, partial [Candidatus Taylorbacteria bacterium]